MASKNDYMKVASAQLLRITSKKENNPETFDFNGNHSKKQNHEKKEQEFTEQHSINSLDPNQMIELGRLLLFKRNAELKLYLNIKKKNNGINDTESEIIMTKNKLAEIDLSISDVDFINENIHDNAEEDDIFEKLLSLKILYNEILAYAENERLSILNEDDDELALIISQKNELLTQIEFIQKNINLKFFTKFPSDYPNKIKADAILSDIHNVMNKIVKIEDENSVNLQSVMNSIKVRLTEQDKNSKAISKYAVGNIKSHFIDTTK
ncbi:MAG TPA: hypothetical protein PKJ08_04855 [Candidatus Cloacimonadota bacterium]|nr:hypothetical protein [Candidatus Cloacimonadota bacterium]HOD53835.1 hypothetical protein [Candidatus Cloacimonadota bacterium]HPM01151.1 hypothetical protein [Candidatus Cloacimonadota bacterium]